MALLFVAQGMSTDIWEEKRHGTLLRAIAAPRSVGLFLTGKLLAGAVLVAATALAGLLIAVLFYDVDLGRLLPALAWCTFAGTALLAFFILLQLFASSQRGGAILATAIVFPLIMIGGSFFPFESMPEWMAAAGRWTPNGLALIRLKEILAGEPPLGDGRAMHRLINFGYGGLSASVHVAALAAASLLLGWLGARTFRYQ